MPAFLFTLALLDVPPPNNPVVIECARREKAIRSIEFVCQLTEVVEPGGDHTTPPRPTDPGKKKPLTRTENRGSFRILFDGERWRVEDTRGRADGWGTVREVVTHDGNLVKRMWGMPGRETWKNSSGEIELLDNRTESPRLEHLPAFLSAHPSSLPGWKFTGMEKCLPTERTLQLDGTATQEWTSGDPKSFDYTRWWFDHQAGYIVRRLRQEPAKHSTAQLDITHAKHEPTRWHLPTAWTCVKHFDDGTPRRTIRVTVERVSVNAPWPDSEFDLTFPYGVRVHDERDGKGYQVREDGSLEEFAYAPDGSPVLPTPPPPPPNWFTVYGPWLVGVLLVGLVVGWLAWRWRRRRASRGP